MFAIGGDGGRDLSVCLVGNESKGMGDGGKDWP